MKKDERRVGFLEWMKETTLVRTLDPHFTAARVPNLDDGIGVDDSPISMHRDIDRRSDAGVVTAEIFFRRAVERNFFGGGFERAEKDAATGKVYALRIMNDAVGRRQAKDLAVREKAATRAAFSLLLSADLEANFLAFDLDHFGMNVPEKILHVGKMASGGQDNLSCGLCRSRQP